MSRKSVWKDEFLIRVYNLARTGLKESKIAKALGISMTSFNIWEVKKPAFKTALDMGRKEYKNRDKKVYSFKDYVYDRLPDNLQKIWLAIDKIDTAKKGVNKIEAILARRGKNIRQHLFIYAWTASNFSVSQAMRKVNIGRAAFDDWKQDPEFAALVDEINWHKKNFFEDHLTKLVVSGDTSATIFVNKTLNKDRGYNEKIDVDMNLSGELNQNIKSIDLMKLPLEARKEVLKSMRKQQEAEKQDE